MNAPPKMRAVPFDTILESPLGWAYVGDMDLTLKMNDQKVYNLSLPVHYHSDRHIYGACVHFLETGAVITANGNTMEDLDEDMTSKVTDYLNYGKCTFYVKKIDAKKD